MTEVRPSVRTLFRSASFFALVAVIMGAVVCATDSGFECGNWPGCTDRALLPSDGVTALLYRNPWIEMIHRTSAILAGPLALACAVVALRLRGVHRLVKILPWVAVAGAFVAGYVGRGIVLGVSYPMWVGTADLLSALACMGSLVVATVALERRAVSFRPTPTGRAAWAAVTLLVVSHAVALWTAGAGSYTRCMSWPVWTSVPGDNALLAGVRYALTGAALVAIVAVVRGLLGRDRALAWTIAGLTGSVLVLGVVIGWAHLASLGFLYSAITVMLLASLVLAAARESFAARAAGGRPVAATEDAVGASR